MTENEAKQKWCPMVRFYVADHDHYDNKPQNDGLGKADKNSGFCIGSACMMFRWDATFKHCYCGLAGKL